MYRVTILVVALLIGGCASGADNVASLDGPASPGYCHRRLAPAGPTDPARPTQENWADYIDYHGPCAGPSSSEMARAQRRFESFRFGRDYIDR
jgi:hypothetical protein